MVRRYLAGLLLVLLVPLLAQGATYEVREGRNNSSCDDIGTIRYAMNNCARTPGDVIDVRQGTYPEQLRHGVEVSVASGNEGSPITLQGHPNETVILNPTAYAPSGHAEQIIKMEENVSWWVIDNLIFDGSNLTHEPPSPENGNHPGANGHMTLGAYGIVVKNCEFKNVLGNAITTGGPYSQFLNNHFHDNADYGMYIGWDHILIDGNYIHDHHGYGVHFYNGLFDCLRTIDCAAYGTVRNNILIHNGHDNPNQAGSDGIVLASGSHMSAYNNLIVDHFGNGIKLYPGTPLASVYNNTIVGVWDACIAIHGIDSTVQNNLCFDNLHDIRSEGSGFTVLTNNNPNDRNPDFVAPENGDYRLKTTSLAAYDGINLSHLFTTDITCKTNPATCTRPASGPWSQGAYQIGAGDTGTILEPSVGTFFITPTGTNTTDCNLAKGTVESPSANPFGTYDTARRCMRAESTLYFRAGIYPPLDSGSTPFSGGASWSAPTILSGYPGEVATLRATAGTSAVYLRTPVTDHFLVLKDLVLDANNANFTNGFAAVGVNDIRLDNVEIKQSYFEVVYLNGAQNIEFRGSQIHHNAVGSLMALQNTVNIVVTNSTLHHSAADGIASIGANNNTGLLVEKSAVSNVSKALVVQETSGLKFYNNLIYSNAYAVHLGTGVAGAQLFYNTAWGNSTTCMLFDNGVTTSQAINNVCWANPTVTSNAGAGMELTTNQCTGPSGCTAGDPQFVDTTPGDPSFLHLGPTSPARDTGTPIPSLMSDKNDKPRPDGSGVDKGAFEEIPGAVLPAAPLGLTPPFRTTFNLIPY